ncbi:MFS general substrate transporter [Collybia nuda]|uniref:MFS general substrate transporter n=1 Tax=Collybia nuda TaxID=64659 RepID=A0A9P5Y215_9AGAR|nr:MFS general substrate transporter [Collybia nuda]
MFASALGGLSGGSYSTYYGRKPVYLVGLSLVVVGSLGVAFARSIRELMFWRFFQTFGASPGISVGAGVIGDVYRLEQRGTAMGVFLAAVLLGPTLAPLAGGLAAHYASWRAMQLMLGLAGLLGFTTLYLVFPETSHPGSLGVYQAKASGIKPGRTYKFINPFRSLLLLRSPLLMSVSIATFLVLLTDFAMLTPMAYTLGKRYNIENEVFLGACFLPNGLGDIVGAPLAGRISDKLVVRYRERRGGVWYPEDRLRVTVFAAATFVPLSSLFFGLLHKYVGGTVGLVLNLICLFMNGVGVQMVLGPTSAYLVDIMHSRSAETIAANNGFRSALISAALAVTLPLIEWIGIAPAYAVFAILAWGGFGILWMVVRYGDRLRASNDVGFSSATNN